MPDLYGNLTPQAVLNGTLQTIVYADNYEDLRNKPSINSVTLIGNKTAAELGLATPADIPVESVNGYQGVVILDGDDIEYSAGVSVNDQIDTVAAAIPTIPVTSVNSKTGAVVLDGDDIEYEAGTSVNSKITDLEAEIGSGPVVSVNGQQGVVELDGTDINYSLTKTINQKIDEVAASIPVVNYPVTSVNTKTGDVVLDGTDIEYSEGVTINDQIGNVADDIPADASELPLGTDFSDPTSTAGAINDKADKTSLDNLSNYSTSETAIGKWYNGDTIYRKVFTNLGISTTANTWSSTGILVSSIGTTVYALNGRVIDSSGQVFPCAVGFSGGNIVINIPLARTNLMVFVFEYTKT